MNSKRYRPLGQICTIFATTILLVAGLSAKAAEVMPMVSASVDVNMALKSDGTVWSWGDNTYGQLGDGTKTTRSKPVKINLTGMAAVSVGLIHVLAMKSDGTVWAWGSNNLRQIGSESVSQAESPLKVGGLSNATAIAAGGGFSVALRADGTVVGWGGLKFDSSSNASTQYNATPTEIRGLSDIIAIAAGGYHAVALKRDGTLWSWGLNNEGQLGDGTTTDRTTPVKVGGLPKIVSIAAGFKHTLAVGDDGKVYSWGINDYDQLGDGTKDTFGSRSAPGLVKMNKLSSPAPVDMTDIATVAAGAYSSFAIGKDGTVYQWGLQIEATYGTVLNSGYSEYSMWLLTGKTHTLPSRTMQIAGGSLHALFLTSDGSVYAQGGNPVGQLGTGNTTGSDNPIAVSDGASGKLNLGSLRTAMSVSGTPTGTKQKQSLTAKLAIDSEDAGKSGKYYVAAKLGNSYFLNNGTSWAPYTGGTFPVFASGTLENKDIAVYTDLDTTGLTGTLIIVGYGTSETDMLNKSKYRTVHTIQ